MREIQADVIRDAVEELFIRANLELPPDVYTRLAACAAAEQGTLASGILHKLVENADIAKKDSIPICQDTGHGLCICGCRTGCAYHRRFV